jgi:hypothetical protein
MSETKEVRYNTKNSGSASKMKEITKFFLSGRLAATLVIPIEMARRHGLEKPEWDSSHAYRSAKT